VEIEREKFSIEDVREYFNENGTIEEWKGLSVKEKRELKIQWHGLMKVAGMFEVKGNPKDSRDAWHELLEKIFSSDIQK